MERAKIRWNGWGWAAHDDALAAREDIWGWLAGELGMPALLATPPRPLNEIALPGTRLAESDLRAIENIVGADRVRSDDYERAFHARGRSYHDLIHLRAGDIGAPPDLVVYPRSGDEVIAILSFASDQGIAIVPFGGGTSVVGGVSSDSGSLRAVLTLDLSGMDRVGEIDTTSRTATAECGIYGPALEKLLAAKGMTLGHFPQSFEFSTLGGWIAHRGAGQGSNFYGRVEDWLVGATLATPTGVLLTRPHPAASAGPDLNGLIVGSEGVFGILLDATFRLHPSPAAVDYRGYLFRDFQSGADAIRSAVHDELPMAMLRLSDAEETRFYRAYGAVGKQPGFADRAAEFYLGARNFDGRACALIAGFEGSAATVSGGRDRFAAIAKSHGAIALGEGQGKRWREGRFHGPYLRDPMMDRGIGIDTLETATSWSKIDALYHAVRNALDSAIRETAPKQGAHGIVMCHISHSYPDGASLYFTYIFPRALGDELAQWRKMKTAATDAIINQGGALSHHHGVGEDHLSWMTAEKGSLGIEVLRAIKRTLDPKGILNPGKLIPG